MRQYFEELALRFEEGFEVEAALAEAPDTLNPPNGLFVIAGAEVEPVGCGAVHFLDPERGEVKRMWVSPAARGQGLASRMLTHLEDLIRQSGRRTVVLDTNKA